VWSMDEELRAIQRPAAPSMFIFVGPASLDEVAFNINIPKSFLVTSWRQSVIF